MCLRKDEGGRPEHVIVKNISNVLIPVGALLYILNIQFQLLNLLERMARLD